jgi:hypothetical protein
LLRPFGTTLVKYVVKIAVSAFLLAAVLPAATLEYLSLDDLAVKATAIVRARVTGSYAEPGRTIIYTHYRIEVLDRWKGPDASEMDIVLPGGSANGLRQTFPGVPRLIDGQEYLLFLWQSPTGGLTHVLGLSQGIFTVKRGDSGEATAYRGVNTDTILNSRGQPVRQSAVTLKLSDFRRRVGRAVEGATR